MTKKVPEIRDPSNDTAPSDASGNSSIVETVSIADPKRRELLRSLSGQSSAKLTDIAAQLAARQAQTDPEEIPSARHKRIQRHLRETQIPRLRACGLVDYDETNDTISLTDCGERIVTEDRSLN